MERWCRMIMKKNTRLGYKTYWSLSGVIAVHVSLCVLFSFNGKDLNDSFTENVLVRRWFSLANSTREHVICEYYN